MPDYQKTKIYKIWSPNTEKVYVGATTQTLAQRMGKHRRTIDTKSKIIIDLGDARIELLQEFPCNSKMESDKKEGEYIRSLNCVNKVISGRTDKEYRIDNKEKIANNKQQYYNTNKDIIRDKHANYRIENIDKINKQKDEYRNNNREKIREADKAFRLANIELLNEKDRARGKIYRDNNKEKTAIRKKLYREANIEKVREQERASRARYEIKRAKAKLATIDELI